jgi:hypothetical protein
MEGENEILVEVIELANSSNTTDESSSSLLVLQVPPDDQSDSELSGLEQSNQILDESFTTKRKKSVKSAKKTSNFSFRNKALRQKGQSYESFKYDKQTKAYTKVQRDEKTMKPPCSTTARCRKSNCFSCGRLTESERRKNFDAYWNCESVETKKSFVKKMSDNGIPERQSNVTSNVRSFSGRYYLLNDLNKKVRVCMTMFCNTLAISPRTLQSWLQSSEDSPETKKRKRMNKRREEEKILRKKAKLVAILKSLSSVPSHYSRKNDDSHYLERNWPSLRRMYK